MSGLEYLGVDDVGDFDYGQLFQAAGGLIQGGVNIYEQSEAEKKLTAGAKSKLEAAIAVDRDASNASAKADVSAQLHSKNASADANAAAVASAAQDVAGYDLSPEMMQLRATAAEKMLALVTKNAKAKPKDGYQAALVKAWTVTVQKARNVGGAIASGGKGKYDKDQESWFVRPVVGKIPGWGVVLGGVGVLGVLGIAVKKIFFRG